MGELPRFAVLVVVVHDQLFEGRRVAGARPLELFPAGVVGGAHCIVGDRVQASRADLIPVDAVQGRGESGGRERVGGEIGLFLRDDWGGGGGDGEFAVHLRLQRSQVLRGIVTVSRRGDFAAVRHIVCRSVGWNAQVAESRSFGCEGGSHGVVIRGGG